MSENQYYLAPYGTEDWYEVTKEQYVKAERAAGFHPKYGASDEPATAGFSSSIHPLQGRLVYGRRRPL